MRTDIETLYQVVEHTWPAASHQGVGPWTIREGQGGGKRVSAATADGRVQEADLEAAEKAMEALGQVPIFMIREGETTLDSMLAHQGYDIVDPVNVYVAPVEDLMDERPPRTAAIAATDTLVIMREIWAAGGIGPARLAVMARVDDPKTYFLSRWRDKPAGCAFLGMHKGIGMLHALEIVPHQRREGLGRWIMKRSAFWVKNHGGTHLSVICTKSNTAANGLYASMGMQVVGQYHYRMKSKK